MNNLKIFSLILTITICISMVAAIDMSFTLKQNTATNLTFHIINSDNSPATASASCDFTLKDSLNNLVINHEGMGFLGNGDFTVFINETSTSNLGVGDYTLSCYDGSSQYVFSSGKYKVTTSGIESMEGGESNTLIISIVVMLIISAFFFIIGFKIENMAGKIICIGLAAVILIATLLFSLVTLTQTLGGWSTIIEGYSTFWFVIKLIFSIALTALCVFILWFAYKVFMIRRGFSD